MQKTFSMFRNSKTGQLLLMVFIFDGHFDLFVNECLPSLKMYSSLTIAVFVNIMQLFNK